MSKKIYKAALIGYYGFGNLGDELLLQASLNFLNEAGIFNNQIIVLSNNPDETSKNFGVKSVSRWNFKTLIKISLIVKTISFEYNNVREKRIL